MSPRFITRAGIVSVVSFLTIITGMQASAEVSNSQVDDGGSGSGAPAGAVMLDETDRSLALIDLSGGTASASINGRGTAPLSETEHALAASSAGDAAVHHPTANETSIRLIESLYAEGGELAGGEPEVAVQPNRGQDF